MSGNTEAQRHREASHIAVLIAAFLCAFVPLCFAAAQAVSIQFENGILKVTGWKAPAAAPAAGWSTLFAVYAGTGDVPSLLGAYSVEQNTLVFRPTFPIAAGVRYRAVFRAPGKLAY